MMVVFRHKKTTIQKLHDVTKDNNMDGIENDDPNTFRSNMYGLYSYCNNDEDDASQDEDMILLTT